MSKKASTVHIFQGGDILGVCALGSVGELLILELGGGEGEWVSFFHAIFKRDLLRCHGNPAHTEPKRAEVVGLIWPDHDGSLS